MAALIEVSFKGNRREFFLWEADPAPPLRAAVIVEADRGEDLGRVHATGDAALHRSRGVPYGIGDATPERKAKRLATTDDVRRHAELRERDEDARRKAMERVRANALVMKVTDAEWQWDRKKLTFYFTAEKRVDFRTLVRELASTFRTRIELKQIGVRDEAKRLDGVGRCGRQYCSASWLPELRPVSLGVAKDQRLSLNPTQISGACGRLMCSLRYEHEFYVKARKRFPKEGKTIQTKVGEERVVSNDIFRERVTLRSAEGETRVVPLAELQHDLGMPPVAGALNVSEDVIAGVVIEGEFEEVEVFEVLEEVEVLEVLEDGVIEPAPVSPAPRSDAPAVQTADTDADAARRPHRRRGRRGGRRNRGGRRPDGQGGNGGDGGSSK